MIKWRVRVCRKLADGTEQIEDLGEHTSPLARGAKAKAIALHAGRMGWQRTRRGWSFRGWTFKVSLAG